MFRISSIKMLSCLFMMFVGLVACPLACVLSFPPDDTSEQTVPTSFGEFNRKTILVGGQEPATSFEQPAFIIFGPDGRLYVSTYTGLLFAISLNESHDVTNVETYKPVGGRMLTGLAFDPAATAENLVLYVASNNPPMLGVEDFTGKVSRLDGFGSGAVTDVIVGLPRSAENHMTFDLAFGPDGRLYIAQGGNTNNGAPAPGLFDNRPERELSAAVLVADVKSPGFSGVGDVEVFAPGLRNAYGMTWHSNGYLYAVEQGSNAGLGDRPTPDGGVIPVPSMKDTLEVLLPDHYFGHPNPARGQFAFNENLADGTPYQPPLKTFATGSVVTGVAEYTHSANGGNLQGSLLITGFVDHNLHYVILSDDGLSLVGEGILEHNFANPVDVAVGSDGTIYVLEAGATLAFGGTGSSKIAVLEPLGADSGQEESLALFSLSSNCTTCHMSLFDEAGNDVSIDAHWRPTMMANSARDPLWQAKVSSEVSRNPALKELIEDKCTTCHMPMARTQAVFDGASGVIFGDGFLDSENALNQLSIDGVSCTVCHQFEDVALGEEVSFSGGYTIETLTALPDRLVYGPFFNPLQDLMRTASGFVPVWGPQIRDAGLCATCHTLYTPVFDDQGNVVDEFPEQTPYLEWEHSEFGDVFGQNITCQDCHMPEAVGSVAISFFPQGLLGRSPFGQHHFVGGNTFMLEIHKSNMQTLDLMTSASELDATLALTLTQLQSDTADLALVYTQAGEDTLTVELSVTNKAGHKFPTGYPARRAWIHLTITDANQEVIFESGAVQSDGRIVGDDANSDSLAFEQHYDLITSPDQVQIYQAIMADNSNRVTYTLLNAESYVQDNRLLPSGFDKSTADSDIAVRGAAADDDDFIGGSDRVTYQVNVAGYSGPFTVEADLLYQSVPPVFVDDLRQSNTEQVNSFVGLYDSADRQPITVASAQTTVP
ncbi:MAG: PQQ-dependent sugar dehydrogenase [Planctomycetota bacterium]|nr:MAG: PQQ-dependent sugar dehydrogenase [Planctomycetota bacterium]